RLEFHYLTVDNAELLGLALRFLSSGRTISFKLHSGAVRVSLQPFVILLLLKVLRFGLGEVINCRFPRLNMRVSVRINAPLNRIGYGGCITLLRVNLRSCYR